MISIINPIQAGVFGTIQAGGHTMPPSVSPLFVVQLQPNLARWYSGTKSLKIHKKFADVITRR